MSLECQEVSQTANTFSVKFRYNYAGKSRQTTTTNDNPYDAQTKRTTKLSAFICGALYVEFKFKSLDILTGIRYNCITLSLRFKKLLDNDDFAYTCRLTNSKNELLVNELRICDDHWVLISRNDGTITSTTKNWMLDVTLSCEISEGQSVFASLYDDTQSADFKLCSKDSSVAIHKTILAAYSPVFKTMLEGEWKESMEGRVELQGVSPETLQHLKDYMYLNKLPETGLQELCALASCYMMSRLVTRCCAELLNKLTTDNAIEISEFAARNNLRSLLIAVFKTTGGGEKSKIDVMSLDCKTIEKEISTTE